MSAGAKDGVQPLLIGSTDVEHVGMCIGAFVTQGRHGGQYDEPPSRKTAPPTSISSVVTLTKDAKLGSEAHCLCNRARNKRGIATHRVPLFPMLEQKR